MPECAFAGPGAVIGDDVYALPDGGDLPEPYLGVLSLGCAFCAMVAERRADRDASATVLTHELDGSCAGQCAL